MYIDMCFPGGQKVKDLPAMGSIPALERSPGGGHDNPLQYSCLEYLHEQRSLVGYGVAKCLTRLSD